MRLVKCKDCGTDVSRNADACPKCGRRFGRVKTSTLFLLALGAIVAMGVMINLISPRPVAPTKATEATISPSATIPPQVKEDVLKVTKKGLARIDRTHPWRVYVDPVFWWRLNAEEKKNWVKIFAIYCSFPDTPHVEVYDDRSGKKLASTGPWELYDVKFY